VLLTRAEYKTIIKICQDYTSLRDPKASIFSLWLS
jgi:hypothetical protein